MGKNLIVILGPTASGKTAMAVQLAADLKGEIISADSRQVYKGMDIGTGKDLAEFQIGRQNIPYHMIDILEPQQEFSVFEFKKKFHELFQALQVKQTLPILVGGTGLYLESVLTDYQMPEAATDEELRSQLAEKTQVELQNILLSMKPDLHNKTDLEDPERLIRKIEIEKARQNPSKPAMEKHSIDAVVYGILLERSELRQRIAVRLKRRLEEGMVEEVSRLREQGVSWERLDSFGLEYRYIARYLKKEITREEMIDRLQIAIGQFAKRQMTWFRRMEKKGVKIEWMPGDDYQALHRRVLENLS